MSEHWEGPDEKGAYCCRACFADGRKVAEELVQMGYLQTTGKRTLVRFSDGTVFLDDEYELTEAGRNARPAGPG